jgi:thiamine biosynthesis protein ThiS
MRILLNGDPADVPDALSVQGLLDHLGLDGRLVAVELNRVVVRRAPGLATTGTCSGAR